MKVVVPIDNKESSLAMLELLAETHWPVGTEFDLISIVPDLDAPESKASIQEAENIAVELHGCLPGCKVAFFARSGDPVEEILDFVNHVQANLVVLGSSCRSGLERLLLGSVSEKVLNRAACPVVIARPRAAGAGRPAQSGFQTIVVPVDDSVHSEVALLWMANFQWQPDARFIITTVVEDSGSFQSVSKILERRAAQLSNALRTTNVTVETHTGIPADAIVRMAKAAGADLIVMGAHGRKKIQQIVLGSVSQTVSQHAPCSVAVVRSGRWRDSDWQQTGVFKKPVVAGTRMVFSGGGGTSAPHTMPGGMM